ncbi:threonine--tRNA ligase [Candidatus Uhrbacteria bacterium]|nr:threonine--tRNA ligase [Candidatus Uhrbacteria bacterium]
MSEQPVFNRRHSGAHILAAALTELYGDVKLGVGPVVENGFYYDVLAPKTLTEEDLPKIEQKMREIIDRDDAFRREELSIEDAVKLFESKGQAFKVELLRDLKEKGTTKVNAEESLDIGGGAMNASVYHTGSFVDLCRGPHVDHSKEIGGAFALTKLAGAYWRGSERNPQLQRVYGILFSTKEELDAHLKMQEEAKKRDHRKLGKELDLFHLAEEVGPGLPLFYPKGAWLRRTVEDLIMRRQEARGYQAIWIPHITKGHLYEISGHLQKYDAMYPPMSLKDEADYYLKPMNCPHFMMLYKSQPHSYRDLPVRWVCTTTNYRYEKSGELSGLTRVRSLTQDDCHVFTTPEGIRAEIDLVLDMVGDVYRIFGFKDFKVRVSVHDPAKPEAYIGDKEIWSQSEATLKELITARGWEHEIGVGEAAFYGPKLDFIFKDAIGRPWQLSTIQLDMNLPNRFDLEYVAADGSKKRPVVIHRAILGSTERFLGILIEHFAGAFPLWLAPEQIRIATVADAFVLHANKLADELRAAGLRVWVDASPEKVGKKIRAAAMMKVPWTVVIGEKETGGGDLHVKVFGEEGEKVIPAGTFVDETVRLAQPPK